jgi:hypothetical protein
MIAVEVAGSPPSVTVRREGRRLVGPIQPRVRDGEIEDQFIQLTEGVIAHETLGDPVDGGARLEVSQPEPDHVVLELTADPGTAGVRRLGLAWPGHPEQRLTGLGARHRPGLPGRHARPRRHPTGRLRAAAVGAGVARLGGLARDARAGRALRAGR